MTPLAQLEGRLICSNDSELQIVLDLMSEHIRLTRAEPGCLRFDVRQSADPMIWQVEELFADTAAFHAHQARTGASRWGQDSAAITRDFHRSAAPVGIGPETAADQHGIADLLRLAFGGNDEARLVEMLRADGDLPVSIVARAGGMVIGHAALSPVAADFPALALAPLAVHRALHRRGIGAALTDAALAAAGDATVIVLGDPGYYARFGFAPVRDWQSPYAGPHLMARGPDASATGARIAHAPAFARL